MKKRGGGNAIQLIIKLDNGQLWWIPFHRR
jgi:hypothetical protein